MDDPVLDWAVVEDALADVARAVEGLDKARIEVDTQDNELRRAHRDLDIAKAVLTSAQNKWHEANNAIYDQVVPPLGEVPR